MSAASDVALLDEAIDTFLEDNPPATTDKHQFWGAQFDAGLAWVHFPVGYGGLGLNPKLAERLDTPGWWQNHGNKTVVLFVGDVLHDKSDHNM